MQTFSSWVNYSTCSDQYWKKCTQLHPTAPGKLCLNLLATRKTPVPGLVHANCLYCMNFFRTMFSVWVQLFAPTTASFWSGHSDTDASFKEELKIIINQKEKAWLIDWWDVSLRQAEWSVLYLDFKMSNNRWSKLDVSIEQVEKCLRVSDHWKLLLITFSGVNKFNYQSGNCMSRLG